MHVFGDLVVFLDETRRGRGGPQGPARRAGGRRVRSDARVFTGTPAELADLLLEWHAAGLDRLPAAAGRARRTTCRSSPAGWCRELQRRGAFRTAYEADTLRGLLGLPRPANRYATAIRAMTDHARKQIHLAAHFPGVNNTTVWSDPAAGSHIEFGSFVHFAQTAERAKFDFLFLAEGLRLREQNGQIYDLDVVGRPDTFTVLAALAAVTDRLGLAGTINSTFNEPYEVARQFATLDHLSGGRAGLERRHLLGRVHRRELPPRRLPAPGPALRAGQAVPRRRRGAVRLLAGRRDRRRPGSRACSSPTRDAGRVRACATTSSTSPAGSTSRAARRAGR